MSDAEIFGLLLITLFMVIVILALTKGVIKQLTVRPTSCVRWWRTTAAQRAFSTRLKVGDPVIIYVEGVPSYDWQLGYVTDVKRNQVRLIHPNGTTSQQAITSLLPYEPELFPD